MWDLIVSVPDHCLSFYLVVEVVFIEIVLYFNVDTVSTLLYL